ncbi:MAG: nucleotidyltransferase family protein [Colwellia sp.]
MSTNHTGDNSTDKATNKSANIDSESESYRLKIIVLAAGKSERFGAIKLLAPVKLRNAETPLIDHVLNQLSSSMSTLAINSSQLVVATGNHHKALSAVIKTNIQTVYCSQASKGIGHTIAQALSSVLSEETNFSHIMISLADLISLLPKDYTQLIESSISHPDKIISAQAKTSLMPPVIFPYRFINQLLDLTGDKGAKAILEKNKECLLPVSVPNALIDIDTQKDLIDWHKRL